MPEEEKRMTKRRKLDSIITKLHHITPLGRGNLEEETNTHQSVKETINVDKEKEPLPRPPRRKVHKVVKLQKTAKVSTEEPAEKAPELSSESGLKKDGVEEQGTLEVSYEELSPETQSRNVAKEAEEDNIRNDEENLNCNGETDNNNMNNEQDCSSVLIKTECLDNLVEGGQKRLGNIINEEVAQEIGEGSEKKKRLYSEGSEADGADYKGKIVLMDEELVGHLFSSDCTERHSKELATNCKKVQNENFTETVNLRDVNSIVQDIEQSSGERNLQLTELKECGVGYEQPTENLTLREESGCVHDISEEFIRSCVSPTKFELVQETLERESERHLCALKLLSCLFSKEELATSNTDGSYAKNCLDSKRLNSLKDLVFSKFPASSTEEREKEWKTIKVKINSKCRVAKFSAKLVNMDVDEARKNARKQDEKSLDIQTASLSEGSSHLGKHKRQQKINRKSKRTKLNFYEDDQCLNHETDSCSDSDGSDKDFSSKLHRQLDAKTEECDRLTAKLRNAEEALRMQVNVQVGVFEMLEKMKACLAQLEGRMASGFQSIQERLDSFEKVPDSPSTALVGAAGTGYVANTAHDLRPSSNGLLMTNSDVKEMNIPELPRKIDCTACGRRVNPAHGTICWHPCLNVLVCKKCNQYYNSGPFTRDEFGIDEQCRWCGDGGSLLCCDKCDKAFCKPCIKRNFGKGYLKQIVDAPEAVEWLCYCCNPKPLSKLVKECRRIMNILQTRKAQKTIFKAKKGPLLPGAPNQKERRNRLGSLSENLGKNSDRAFSPMQRACSSEEGSDSSKDHKISLNKIKGSRNSKQNVSSKVIVNIDDESDSGDTLKGIKDSRKKTLKANCSPKRNIEIFSEDSDIESNKRESRKNKKVESESDSESSEDSFAEQEELKTKSASKKGRKQKLKTKTLKGEQNSESDSNLSDFITMVKGKSKQTKKRSKQPHKGKGKNKVMSGSEGEAKVEKTEKSKRTRGSKKSGISEKQTRKRPRKVTSSENESDESGSDEAMSTRKCKQANKRRKRGKLALESDDDKVIGWKKKRQSKQKAKKSSSESEEKIKKGKNSRRRKSLGKKKGGKKHYIEKDSGESEDVKEEEEEEEASPSKHKGRKKIRKLIKDDKLTEETKRARKLEEERRKRLLERTRNNADDMPSESAKVSKLVLESDQTSKEIIVEVKEDLVQHLKPHQCQGIQFMYDCVIESVNSWKKNEPGGGGILAHCMGLGKTLQVVALVHTLMTNKEINLQRVLVVCPLNTVLNWQVEFDKWLSVDDRLEVFVLQDVSGDNWRRADMLNHWLKYGGVMILGYSLYRNLSQCLRVRSKNQKKIFKEALVDPGPHLVICDEGHILRNDATAISKALNAIKTRRRIVLTGTPLQNNLIEYHCMVSFVKPSLLGTRKEYTNTFANPIQNGQCADSTSLDVQLMKQRCHVLHKMLEGCVQRMDYSVLIPFLPRKHEYVIKVRLSSLQRKLYQHFLSTFVCAEGAPGKKGVSLFSDYQALMRIWTHPWCLKLEAMRRPEKFLDSDSMDDFVVHTDEEEDEEDDEEEEEWHSSSSSEEEALAISESEEDRRTQRRRRGQDLSSSEGEDDDESDDESEDEGLAQSSGKSSNQTSRPTVNIDGEEITVVDITSRAGTSARKHRDKRSHSLKTDTKERKGKAIAKAEPIDSSSDDFDGDKPNTNNHFGNTRSGTAFKEVEDVELEEEKEWYDEFVTEVDEFNVELSGKLVLLMEILADAEAVEDKVLVFSQSLVTLDLIEKMLGGGEIGGDRENWCRGCDYFRMDGSTSAAMRQRWADIFNDEDNKNARLFLISTKAGGLGINLVAANRVIVFDVSWNPSHDVQSIFRVYRFGQSKAVFVYRFIAQGTMEEKIYDRQVTKLAIAGRVVDEQQIERHFNSADLTELYSFNPDVLEEDKETDTVKDKESAIEIQTENASEGTKETTAEKEGHQEVENAGEKGGTEKGDCSEVDAGTSHQTETPIKVPEVPKLPLPKDAVLADLINRLHPKWIVNYHEHDSLLQDIESEKLTEEEMKAAWEAYEAEKSGKSAITHVPDTLLADHIQTQQHAAERIRLNSEMLQQIQQIRELQEIQQRQEMEERMRLVRQEREQLYQRQREALLQEHHRQQDEIRRQNQMRFIQHMTRPGTTPQLQLGQNTINVQTQLPSTAPPRHPAPPSYLTFQTPSTLPIRFHVPSGVASSLSVTQPTSRDSTHR